MNKKGLIVISEILYLHGRKTPHEALIATVIDQPVIVWDVSLHVRKQHICSQE